MTTPMIIADPSFGWDDLTAWMRRGLHRFDRLLSGRFWLLIATVIATAVSLFGAFPA